MKKTTALLLVLALCIPALFSLAEEVPSEEIPVFLPAGIWSLTEGQNWEFITENGVALNPEQQAVAEAAGIVVVDGVIPPNSAIRRDVLLSLFPGNEEYFALPQTMPALEMFSLTGEWSEDEDGVFHYRHAEGNVPLTMEEVFAILNGQPAPTSGEEKIIYLTIDDTPSNYTMELLATLDRLDVKATFFVVGAYVKRSPLFLRAIYSQGHAIANHSYSHDSTTLTSSFKSCLNDFQRCEAAVAEALGFELDMPILRIPYGAGTLPVAFRTQLQQSGYLWIDWNALNGDTEPNIKSDQDALDRAFETAGRYDGSIVMLVHDGKKRTIRTMEEMVTHFREQGYEFRTLDTNIEKIPGVRMGFPK